MAGTAAGNKKRSRGGGKKAATTATPSSNEIATAAAASSSKAATTAKPAEAGRRKSKSDKASSPRTTLESSDETHQEFWWNEWLNLTPSTETRTAWRDIMEGKAPVISSLTSAIASVSNAGSTASASTAGARESSAGGGSGGTSSSTTTTTATSKAANKKADNSDSEQETSNITKYGYQLFLWTHCLQRLLLESGGGSNSRTKNHTKNDLMMYGFWTHLALKLAVFITQPLGTPKSPSVSSRAMVGRAVLVSTIAALRGLQGAMTNTWKSSDDYDDDNELRTRTIVAGIRALEVLVHWQQGSIFTSATAASLASSSENPEEERLAYWSNMHTNIDTWLHDGTTKWMLIKAASHMEWDQELTFWKVLHGDRVNRTTSTDESPGGSMAKAAAASRPTKRARASSSTRTKKGGKKVATQPAPDAGPTTTLSEALQALVHRCEADRVTIDGRLAPKRWASVTLAWFIQGQVQLLTLMEQLLDRDDWSFDDMDPVMPLDTVRVALASCLLRTMNEISVCCGSRSPTGGVEAYVKLFGIKKTKTDLRNQAAVVLYKLVALHTTSYGDKFDTQTTKGSKSIYPFTMQAVRDMARAIGVPTGDGDVERLECLAVAYGFQLRCCEPKFLTFCIQKLSNRLKLADMDAGPSQWTSLPVPSASSTHKKAAASFGGVYDDNSTTLQVILRSFYPECCEGVLLRLIEIAELCYNTTKDTMPKDRRKRRKKEPVVSRPMAPIYISLATEALEALSSCLEISQTSIPNSIRSNVRGQLRLHHISRLIDLGLGAKEFVNLLRGGSEELADSEPEFSPQEKRLWDAYSSACVLLGRGCSTHKGERIVHLGSNRQSVYREIVAHALKTEHPTSFPLWLCAPHRRLLSANLASESRSDTQADQFLVDGWTAAIFEAFSAIYQGSLSVTRDATSLSASEGIPLSLSTARMLCLAMVRLDAEARIHAFAAIVEALHEGVQATRQYGGDVLGSNEECGGFLARVVATCTSLAVLLTCNELLADRLYDVVGTAQTPAAGKRGFNDVELLYCSVFDDSSFIELEQPGFVSSSLNKEVSARLQSCLEESFCLGFETASVDQCHLLYAAWAAIGRSDLWKLKVVSSLESYKNPPTDIPMLILELREDICFVDRLLCQAYGQVSELSFFRVIKEKGGDSSLSRQALMEKIKKELHTMMSKAESIFDDVVSRFLSNDRIGIDALPSDVLCLLDALPSYLAFTISCHTRVDLSFYTRVQLARQSRAGGRDRSYSSDSENCSDDESTDTQDVGVDAVDRFRVVCSTIGAVPYHPDWLDSDCKLLEGLSSGEARDIAIRALAILVKLTRMSFSHLIRSLAVAIRHPTEKVMLAAEFCRLHSHHDTEAKSMCPILTSSICTAVEMDNQTFDVLHKTLYGDLGDENRKVDQRWLIHASQRCIGSLNELIHKGIAMDLERSHLRGGHEWERLFAGALSTCMLMTKSELADCNAHSLSCRWRHVFKSALSALVPGAALLRFAVCGKGRKYHPLKSTASNLHSFDALDSSDALTTRSSTDEPVALVTLRQVLAIASFAASVGETSGLTLAMNVLVDAKSLSHLREAARCQLALTVLTDLTQIAANQESRGSHYDAAMKSLFECISQVLDPCDTTDEGTNDRLSAMRAAVSSNDIHVATFTATPISVCATLSNELREFQSSLHEVPSQMAAVITATRSDYPFVGDATRLRLMRALCSCVSLGALRLESGADNILSSISSAFNLVPDERLRSWIEGNIFPEACAVEQRPPRKNIVELVATLLSGVLSVQGDDSFSRPQLVFEILVHRMQNLSHFDSRSHASVFGLLSLYACRCLQLHTLGSRLLQIESQDGNMLRSLAMFGAFVRGLLEAPSAFPIDREEELREAGMARTLGNVCSHSSHSGFIDQHWYHCQTCGLTGDKGCCTLCALICHENHEVSYSRFSAFFCDCGAEGGPTSAGRVFSCKCLQPLTQEVVDKAVTEGCGIALMDKKLLAKGYANDNSSCLVDDSDRHDLFVVQCAEIARFSFAARASESLKLLIKQGRKEDWPQVLLRSMSKRFAACKEQVHQNSNDTDAFYYELLQRRLHSRPPAVPLISVNDEPLLNVVAFQAGNFRLKISNDSSIDNLKRAMLCTSGACRFAMAADSRARVVIAESNALSFCTFLPVLSNAYSARPSPVGLVYQRKSASVVGTVPLSFSIVGVKLCPTSEDRLAIWGTHEASIGLLGEGRNGLDRVIDLEVGLGTLETGSGVVLDCGWLPGSSTCLLVCCTRSILFFELGKSASESKPAAAVKVGAESVVRGHAILKNESIVEAGWKVYVLMENGHLHSFDLCRDESESLRVKNLNLDPKHSIKLPVYGSTGTTSPFSLTLGEGILLNQLLQSKILLYQAVGESVLALRLDDQNSIVSSFTLLPRSVSALESSNSKNVTGPFTHWTELGVVSDNGSEYFRVCCIGRRIAKDPVLLCIDFNEIETKVRELSCHGSGYCLSTAPTVEGLAAFSGPFLCDDVVRDSVGAPSFAERAFLAVLFSNGSLQLFGEKTGTLGVVEDVLAPGGATLPLSLSGRTRHKVNDVPLLAFEELVNVMELDEIVISGMGIGTSDEIRRKLLRDNDSFLAGTSLEGFGISIRSKQAAEYQAPKVVVAMKFLFGATLTSSIPQKITVQGRDMDLLPNTRKWYSFFLTPQEVAQAVRNGFVSVRFSETFDFCSNAIVDSMECYACAFSAISSLVPNHLQSIIPGSSLESCRVINMSTGQTGDLTRSLQTLDRFCSVLRPLRNMDQTNVDFLRVAVQEASMELGLVFARYVESILKSYGFDDDYSESFCDAAILKGCLVFLSSCHTSRSSDAPAIWRKLVKPLRFCMQRAAKVAAMRPLNFQTILENEVSPGALASRFIVNCLHATFASPSVISDFVDLCLIEMAAGSHSEYGKGSFDGLRRLLDCCDQSVVALGCSSIARFCDRFRDPSENPRIIGHDPFSARQMVVLYRCDGCGLLPIKDTRFSLLDDHHPVDLCQSCYKVADEFAALKRYSEASDVEVDERKISGNGNLTCADIKMMQSVTVQADNTKGEIVQRQQLFDNFLEGMFQLALELLAKSGFSNQAFINLSLVLVHYSEASVERAKRLAKELTRNVVHLLRDPSPSKANLVSILQALVKLVVWNEGAASCLSGSELGDEASSTNVLVPMCAAHGVAATVRKSCQGYYAGREYFCCGKEFNSQCKFFRWVDESESVPSHFNDMIAKVIWDELVNAGESLRRWVTSQGKTKPSSNLDTEGGTSSRVDIVAGALCSRHRLRIVTTSELLLLYSAGSLVDSRGEDVLDAVLQLLPLVTSSKGNALKDWSPFLCEVISSSRGKDSTAYSRAKRSLQQLCGSRQLYVTVRAHFSFAANCERLASVLGDLIGAGIAMKEKARQCGPHWKDERRGSHADIKAGDLLGTEDLIPEDILTSQLLEDSRKILAELMGVAKKRPEQWATCFFSNGFPHDPATQSRPPAVFFFTVACLLKGESQVKALRLIDLGLPHGGGVPTPALNEYESVFAAPVVATDALDLSVSEAAAFVVRLGCNGNGAEARQLACSIVSKLFDRLDPSLSGQLFQRLVDVALLRTRRLGRCVVYVLMLLNELLSRSGSSHINVQHTAARVLSYWRNQTNAIRFKAPQTGRRYELSPCLHCAQALAGRRGEKKMGGQSTTIGAQTTTTSPDGTKQRSAVSATSKGWLPDQVTFFSRGRLEGWRESVASDEFNSYSSFKYRLVVAEIHLEVTDPSGRFAKTISFYVSPRPVSDVSQLKAHDYSDRWQLCGSMTIPKGANRGSVKLDKPVVASNLRVEYTSFYERPGASRTSSDGSFVVHCPRCTRVVNNAHGVCGNCGEVCFQCRKCRHINYDRLDAFLCAECGYCASGTFAFELTAAIATNAVAIQNDVEYEQSCHMLNVATRLYDDLQSSLRETLTEAYNENDSNNNPKHAMASMALRRTFDGLPPRPPSGNDDSNHSNGIAEGGAGATAGLAKLGRQGSVVKAVARWDSGGAASSSTMVMMSRSQSLLRLSREWRESTAATSSSSLDRRRLGGGDFILHHMSSGRAGSGGDTMMMDEGESNELFGLLEGRGVDDPLSRLLASMQNRRDRRAAAAASATAAAASEPNGDNNNNGMAADTTTTANANNNSTTTSNAAASAAIPSGTKGKGTPTLSKETQELCDRLYLLLREAEREAYLLEQRVTAWDRLNCDALLECGNGNNDDSASSLVCVAHFDPTQCSACASTVAMYLLQLWLSLLKVQPDQVLVSQDLVQLLISGIDTSTTTGGGNNGWNHHRGLNQMMRQALKDIALVSIPTGSQLVLEALRLRLYVTQSVACSEVLGSIIEGDDTTNTAPPPAFAQLAHQFVQDSLDADQDY